MNAAAVDAIVAQVREHLAEHVEPRLLSVEAAAAALAIGRTKAFELVESGALRSLKVGTRRLIPVAALDEFVAALEREGAA